MPQENMISDSSFSHDNTTSDSTQAAAEAEVFQTMDKNKEHQQPR